MKEIGLQSVLNVVERCRRSPTGMRFVRGAFWSMAGVFLSRGLMMAAWVLVARILGKSAYGEFGVVRSTVDMFTTFAGFGLGLTATKHVAEFRFKDHAKTGRIISLSLLFAAFSGGLIALLLVAFGPWLSVRTLNAPHLAPALQIGGVMLFASALNGAQNGALAGFEAYRSIARINILCGVIAFPLFWACANQWGLYGVLWAHAANLCLISILNHLTLRKTAKAADIPLKWKSCWREFPVICSFSLPVVISGIIVSSVRWAGNAMLVNQTDGYSQMGLFSAALIIQTTLQFASSTVGNPLLSMLSNLGQNTPAGLARFNMLVSWGMGVSVALPLFCFPEIAELLLGKDYRGPTFHHTLALILLCTCIIMYKEGLSRILAARNLMWWGFLSNSVWACILLISAHYFVRYGGPGLAFCYVVAYVLNTLIIIPLYTRRRLVPKNTLLSRPTFSIWITLIVLTGLVFLNLTLSLRLVVFIASTLVLLVSFQHMAFYKTHE